LKTVFSVKISEAWADPMVNPMRPAMMAAVRAMPLV